MKIAQITATFPPYFGGTGNVCYHNSLELARAGHDITVFTSKYHDGSYQYPKLFDVVRFKPFFRLGNAPFTPQLVNIDKFDIIHLHYPFVFGTEFVLLNTFLKNNILVITHHQALTYNSAFDYLSRIYTSIADNFILSKARKILTPSLDHLINSKEKFLLRRNKDDLIELPNGVDIIKFNPKIKYDELMEKYKINNDKIILFVGALDSAHSFKGVDILIKAFSKINRPNTLLMIVGDGDMKHYYQELAKRLGILNKIIFTGFVSEDDLPKHYALSSILVLPSVSSGEIFGLVLVEAMACGKPVIATNLLGVRTVVDNEKNGYCVPPNDPDSLAEKIDYLLENEDLAKKFGIEGRKKVEDKYPWEKIGKKLEKIYLEVLS